jgi:spore coat polysaccharide biosynthesis protein SpsF
MILTFQDKNCDYLSNVINRTYPRGLDIEIMKFETLEIAFLNAKTDFEKEHVTTYIYKTKKLHYGKH